ncbi:MAG: hydroxymethylglutaryl-CoA reductase, degradative, partial [Gammaproteobacteria bacterium]|nr:hydroxymethylglutaryl-CoA reductase, degradative [Gammaproteobacteria bacterium]
VIAVDVFVDTCDAMGANLVNTICEAIAPRIAELSNGSIALRILSNLADRSLVTARVRYCLDELPTQNLDAETVRDRIVLASDIAAADPYRAATHNKGIMNGIDALSIATGNDWRAIEAGAHAYAASTGAYRPLTEWSATANGDLAGRITIPLKVGIVGGTLEANPAAAVGIEIAGVDSARELAELMAAVGLAQNFAALRALATSGIQEGHMRLHARSVASAAEVPDELFDELVERLVAAGEVRKWKAREILADMHQSALPAAAPVATAAGKVILLGEHAVVYGKHALALPIVDAVSAEIEKVDAGLIVAIPEWGERHQIDAGSGNAGGIGAAVALVTQKLGVVPSGYALTLHSALPRAMGLGSSAAIAVAMIRAFDAALDLGLSDDDVNALAFECEKLAHGRPSGIDNTIATYATPMLFRNGDTPELERLQLSAPPPLVIACSHEAGLTRTQVRGVEQRRERSRARYDALFDEIDEISIAGAAALLRADYRALGELMNLCHGLLNAIQVSTPELERMVSLARAAGSTGAKLTGAGGGGSIVALCPGTIDDVTAALKSAGFKTIRLDECKEA